MNTYNKWGTDTIHPKILKDYGFECIGNMHREWETGLSSNTIEKILKEYKVETALYNYVNENIRMIQTHTAYNIKEARAALNLVLSTAEQVSRLRWESKYFTSRFQLLKPFYKEVG